MADQKQKAAREEQTRKEHLTQVAIDALVETDKPPIDKAGDQFQQDVNRISEIYYADTDIQIWCAKMTEAIQKTGFHAV